MQFDENFLKEMGLSSMPEDKKQDFLNYIQEELEVRIGRRIAEGLSEEKLQEFDALTDIAEVSQWLEKNRPDYREIVNRTVEEMKAAIKENHDALLN